MIVVIFFFKAKDLYKDWLPNSPLKSVHLLLQNIPQRSYSQFKIFLKEEITKEDIPQVKSFPPQRYSSKKKFPTLLHHSTKSESPSTSPDVCSIFNIHAHLRHHHSRSANHWWCLKRVQSFQNSPFA